MNVKTCDRESRVNMVFFLSEYLSMCISLALLFPDTDTRKPINLNEVLTQEKQSNHGREGRSQIFRENMIHASIESILEAVCLDYDGET